MISVILFIKIKETNMFEKIREIIRSIPPGKVMTYGQVARLAGSKNSRIVVYAIYGNQDKSVPCHRVVFKDGSLAEKFSLGGWQEQKARLEIDGTSFSTDKVVNLKKSGLLI